MPRILRLLPHDGSVLGVVGVSLPLGKPYAALCFIALETEGVPRGDLAALLWPNAAPARSRQSVRQALHVIRAALEPGSLLEESKRLSIAPDRLSVDLNELDEALSAGDLPTAHRMWRGGPLAGFSLADAPAFNDWADQLRLRYEARLGGALSSAGLAAADAGDVDGAMELLDMALDVRSDAGTHAARVRCLLVAGRVEEAGAAPSRPEAIFGRRTRETATLSPDAITVAAHLAGHPSGVEAHRIGAGAGLPDERASAAVAELFGRRMVKWTDDGRLDFVHDGLRDVARLSLGDGLSGSVRHAVVGNRGLPRRAAGDGR